MSKLVVFKERVVSTTHGDRKQGSSQSFQDWYLGSSLVAFNSSYDILMAALVLVDKGDTQVKMVITVFLETKSLRS